MQLFDSHAHYNDEKFKEDRDELLKKIKQAGVTRLVSAGYNIESSNKAMELSQRYDFIYATVGISPNDIPETMIELEEQLKQIEGLLQQKEKIVAMGEIGLDYYWNKENKKLQQEAFIKQIKLANTVGLPIVIHTREAVIDTLEILKKHPVLKKGVFHCCPLNRELVKEALKLDFHISFAGPITFKNAKNADEIIQMVPMEKVLIETDSPYLSPEPNRGKRNDSRNVRYMAEKIAKVKQLPIEQVAKITYANALNLFEITK